MLSQSELKQLLRYDQSTGAFTWTSVAACNVKRIVSNTRAGTVTVAGYRQLQVDGVIYKEHRLAWFYMYGVWPEIIDHINHDRSDNRIANLRSVSKKENSRNRSNTGGSNTGHQGIWFNPKTRRYVAYIKYEGKKVFQKSCETLNSALAAREEKLKELGFHDNHGC
jgi:hypothetical protein